MIAEREPMDAHSLTAHPFREPIDGDAWLDRVDVRPGERIERRERPVPHVRTNVHNHGWLTVEQVPDTAYLLVDPGEPALPLCDLGARLDPRESPGAEQSKDCARKGA